MAKILVVEDGADLRKLFLNTLKKNGYDSFGAKDSKEVLKSLETMRPDLIISEVNMPGTDGFAFVEEIRRTGNDMPVLFLTEKGDIRDRQSGFRVGADDYMIKPVDIQEMLLRVQALLRRTQNSSDNIINVAGTVLTYDNSTVTDLNGEQVLPQKEFQVIYKLLSYPGQTFTRRQILDDVWGEGGYEDSHTLDVHISRLRERFRNNRDFTIVTIRGLGYKAVMTADQG